MMPWPEFLETCRALAHADDEAAAVAAYAKLDGEQYWNQPNPIGFLRGAMFDRAEKMYVDRVLAEHAP